MQKGPFRTPTGDVAGALELLREADLLVDSSQRSRTREIADAALERASSHGLGGANLLRVAVNVRYTPGQDDVAVTARTQLLRAAETVREAAARLQEHECAETLKRAAAQAIRPDPRSVELAESELLAGLRALQQVIGPTFERLRHEQGLQHSVRSLTRWEHTDVDDQAALVAAGIGPAAIARRVTIGLAIILIPYLLIFSC